MRPIFTHRVAWFVGLSVGHSREPCKDGWTDRDAVWVVDSGRPKEACIRWGANWDHLTNTTELSMCGGNAAVLWTYFDHLLLLLLLYSAAVLRGKHVKLSLVTVRLPWKNYTRSSVVSASIFWLKNGTQSMQLQQDNEKIGPDPNQPMTISERPSQPLPIANSASAKLLRLLRYSMTVHVLKTDRFSIARQGKRTSG